MSRVLLPGSSMPAPALGGPTESVHMQQLCSGFANKLGGLFKRTPQRRHFTLFRSSIGYLLLAWKYDEIGQTLGVGRVVLVNKRPQFLELEIVMSRMNKNPPHENVRMLQFGCHHDYHSWVHHLLC
jgi:hypothetical protein